MSTTVGLSRRISVQAVEEDKASKDEVVVLEVGAEEGVNGLGCGGSGGGGLGEVVAAALTTRRERRGNRERAGSRGGGDDDACGRE